VRLLDDIVAGSTATISFALAMLGLAAGVALLLGMVGVYGVVSHVASQRTREIGVRMALGASPLEVKRLVLGQGLALAGVGVGAGLIAALWSSRLVARYLVGVSQSDPITYVSVALALTVVTVVASAVPAWRAAGVDPIRALRSE
jgi:ABC-type antimicrobial peptide transport system permease subunit